MQIGRERENLLEMIENNHISDECAAYKRFGANDSLTRMKCNEV